MYKVPSTGLQSGVIRIADGAHIPPDMGNDDYRTFLEWQKLGNTPTPYQKTQQQLDLEQKLSAEAAEAKALLDKVSWDDQDRDKATRLLLAEKYPSTDKRALQK